MQASIINPINAGEVFSTEKVSLSALISDLHDLTSDYFTVVKEEKERGTELRDEVARRVREFYDGKKLSGDESLTIRSFFLNLQIERSWGREYGSFKASTQFKSEPYPANLNHQLNLLCRRLSKDGSKSPLELALFDLQQKIDEERESFLKRYRELLLKTPKIHALMEGYTTGTKSGRAITTRYMDQHLTSTMNHGVTMVKTAEMRPTSIKESVIDLGGAGAMPTSPLPSAIGAADGIFSSEAFRKCVEIVNVVYIDVKMIEALKAAVCASILQFFSASTRHGVTESIAIPRGIQYVLLDNFTGVEVDNGCCSHKCKFTNIKFHHVFESISAMITALNNMIETIEMSARGCSGVPSDYQRLIANLSKIRDDAGLKLVELMHEYRILNLKLKFLYDNISAFDQGRFAGATSGRKEIQQGGTAASEVAAVAVQTLNLAKQAAVFTNKYPTAPDSAAELKEPLLLNDGPALD